MGRRSDPTARAAIRNMSSKSKRMELAVGLCRTCGGKWKKVTRAVLGA